MFWNGIVSGSFLFIFHARLTESKYECRTLRHISQLLKQIETIVDANLQAYLQILAGI